MKNKAKSWANPGVIGSVLGLVALNLLAPLEESVVAQPSFRDFNPGIAPIQSRPSGKTYGQWAASWWQWAAQTPASINPILDKGDCSVGQTGRVWFIGGTFSGEAGKVTVRNCTIPVGTALFFPLINNGYFAFLNDPPETRTEEYLRAQVVCDAPTLLEAKIDGVPVKNPSQYLAESPLFDVQLPEDNVFGVDESVVPQLLLSPSVDRGYYLFLQPLPPGNHTIKWKAKITCPIGTFEQNNTYNIVVSPRRHR